MSAPNSSDQRLLDLIDTIHNRSREEICLRHNLPSDSTPMRIVEEIRRDGSNSIATLFRGGGVHYDEIVRDVAKQMKAKVPLEATDERQIEPAIIARVVEKYYADASPSEQGELKDMLAQSGRDFSNKAGLHQALLLAGTNVLREIVTKVIVRQAAAQGIKLGARSVAALIPGLNIVLGAWMFVDLAGPAFRKTVPTVVQLAIERMDLSN